MKIAVTGASGFVGSHLLKALCVAGYHVTALEHITPLPILENLHIVKGSLESKQTLSHLVEGADVVIHCGGVVNAKGARDYVRLNENATYNLVEACKGKFSRRVLFVSSLAAREPEISPYAKSKKNAEKAFGYDVDFKWDVIRPPAIYGAGDRQTLKIFKTVKAGLSVVPPTNRRFSLIHVDDFVKAVMAWVENVSEPQGYIYEIDDGRAGGYRWDDVIHVAARNLGRSAKIIKAPEFVFSSVAIFSEALSTLSRHEPYLSVGKAREICHPNWVANDTEVFMSISDWQASTDIELGIAKTIQGYQKLGWL